MWSFRKREWNFSAGIFRKNFSNSLAHDFQSHSRRWSELDVDVRSSNTDEWFKACCHTPNNPARRRCDFVTTRLNVNFEILIRILGKKGRRHKNWRRWWAIVSIPRAVLSLSLCVISWIFMQIFKYLNSFSIFHIHLCSSQHHSRLRHRHHLRECRWNEMENQLRMRKIRREESERKWEKFTIKSHLIPLQSIVNIAPISATYKTLFRLKIHRYSGTCVLWSSSNTLKWSRNVNKTLKKESSIPRVCNQLLNTYPYANLHFNLNLKTLQIQIRFSILPFCHLLPSFVCQLYPSLIHASFCSRRASQKKNKRRKLINHL